MSDLKTEPKRTVKNVDLKIHSECFENGNVTWSIQWSNKNANFDPENKSTINQVEFLANRPFKVMARNGVFELCEITDQELVFFKVRAELSGGSGQNAWQHTQLFRQNLNDHSFSGGTPDAKQSFFSIYCFINGT